MISKKRGIFTKKKLVLALGGGAARGLCNLGVLKAIERHFGRDKFPFDLVIGTSIGSLVGGAYCAGLPLEELEQKALKFTWPNLVDFALHPTGFIKGDKLETLITELVGGKRFEDLKIPFALTTTDLQNGEELIHTSGDLVRLVRASCSWPGFFSSVDVDGRMLVDGGLRNSVPTKAAYLLGGTFVVAVNPGFAISSEKIDNAFKALAQSIQIMGEELNAYQAYAADLAICPEIKNVDQFGFDKSEYIMKQGDIAAEAVMEKLKRKLMIRRII